MKIHISVSLECGVALNRSFLLFPKKHKAFLTGSLLPHCAFSCLHARDRSNSPNHFICYFIYAGKLTLCTPATILTVANVEGRQSCSVSWGWRLLSSVSPSPFLSLSFCQMWGHGRSHIDLSTGSSEDPTAVVLHHPLRVWGSAQYCQRGQCGPCVPARPPALPQVGTQEHFTLSDSHVFTSRDGYCLDIIDTTTLIDTPYQSNT